MARSTSNTKIRITILERDNDSCRKCNIFIPQGRYLHMHHIIAKCNGGKESEDNLITLCWLCHSFAPMIMKEEDKGKFFEWLNAEYLIEPHRLSK